MILIMGGAATPPFIQSTKLYDIQSVVVGGIYKVFEIVHDDYLFLTSR